jgi:hypothetical protein
MAQRDAAADRRRYLAVVANEDMTALCKVMRAGGS